MNPDSAEEEGKTVRAFIAIDLPGEIIGGLSGILSGLKKRVWGVRWVRGESIHLTLKFLGEIKEDEAQRLGEALEDLPGSPIELSLGGPGAFPDMRRPRVVWLGLEGETGKLDKLWREVEERCAALGFPRERRGFSPHLTLGRVKERKRGKLAELSAILPEALGELKTVGMPPFTVNSVHLYRSILRPEGAEYVKLRTFTLKG